LPRGVAVERGVSPQLLLRVCVHHDGLFGRHVPPREGTYARSGERADHDVVAIRIAESELSGPGGGIRLGLLLELTDKDSGA
jgi:hypothetical protein